MASLGNVAELVTALSECSRICGMCADACLGEGNVQSLVRCIRVDLDCAAVCDVTADVLARAVDPDWRLIRGQLQSCLTACAVCAEECDRHGPQHAHCRVCAETCRATEQACRQALAKVPAMAMT
jgi:hypothetical protein